MSTEFPIEVPISDPINFTNFFVSMGPKFYPVWPKLDQQWVCFACSTFISAMLGYFQIQKSRLFMNQKMLYFQIPNIFIFCLQCYIISYSIAVCEEHGGKCGFLIFLIVLLAINDENVT